MTNDVVHITELAEFDDHGLIDHHALWLDAYYETVAVAQTPPYDPKLPLVESQVDAYRTLPDLIDQCRKAWLEIPEPVRPSHYLSYA